MENSNTIGEALDILFADLNAKKNGNPEKSYTASLIKKGPRKCAKKLGEEAVELAIALVSEEEEDVHNEAADLLYHFAAALISRNINPKNIALALQNRRGIGGLDEKASRPK